MPVGLVTSIEFYDKRNQLFVGGKEGLFIIDLDIRFKYDPTMAILLDPKGSSITVGIKKSKDYTEKIEKKDEAPAPKKKLTLGSVIKI